MITEQQAKLLIQDYERIAGDMPESKRADRFVQIAFNHGLIEHEPTAKERYEIARDAIAIANIHARRVCELADAAIKEAEGK